MHRVLVIDDNQDAADSLVAISGYSQDEDIRRSKEAGFDAHIAKPARTADIESLLSVTGA